MGRIPIHEKNQEKTNFIISALKGRIILNIYALNLFFIKLLKKFLGNNLYKKIKNKIFKIN